MIAPDLFRGCLTGVRRCSGADGATLFIAGPGADPASSLFLHEGDAAPVPELASADGALAGIRKLEDAARQSRLESDVPQVFPSADTGGFLLRIPLESAETGPVEADASPGSPSAVWIGLRLPSDSSDGPADSPEALLSVAGLEPQWLLGLVAKLLRHQQRMAEVLVDVVTGLPLRAEFQVSLDRAMRQARHEQRTLSLLMINPDDFAAVNDAHGSECGDQLLCEIAQRIRAGVAEQDIVARFGGAIFVALLRGGNEERHRETARQVLEQVGRPYLERAVELSVGAGLVTVDPDSQAAVDPPDLIRRAGQALHMAKAGGSNRLRCWEPALESGIAGNVDRLSGVFTGNMTKDYRNMRLFAEICTVVAGSSGVPELVSRSVELLQNTLRAERLGIFEQLPHSAIRLLGGHGCSLDPDAESTISEASHGLLEAVKNSGCAVETSFVDNGGNVFAAAVPLLAGDAYLGCLYLEGHCDQIVVDAHDLDLLQAVVTQLAVALDRARLWELQRSRQEAEQQLLQAEIDQLRKISQQGGLVCRSQRMTALLATAQKAAQADATVLIRGESGTGKELLSRTIHDLGPRRERPLVIVDCAAIPATLIESELFGHERGAYTGAQQRKNGRVVEAEGGTIILDEIGELPLEVQSKLLRFVQEKQFCPVGGNRVREVDARVVAVTNRDLQQEVHQGRFREDLFHRLNVIQLEVPPLRERSEDVPVLAEHFLKQFSSQYQPGSPRRFSEGAMTRMARYPWPGNVRELRNCVMKAVILSTGHEIGPRELGLSDDEPSVSRPQSTSPDPLRPVSPVPVEAEDPWQGLDQALELAVRTSLDPGVTALPPLGQWLAQDLVHEAHAAAGQVLSRGARLIGIPEATFRRRLRKAQNPHEAGRDSRPAGWHAVTTALTAVVRNAGTGHDDLLLQTRNLLLRHVLEHSTTGSVGAALMGITVPTYRRWKAELEPFTDSSLSATG